MSATSAACTPTACPLAAANAGGVAIATIVAGPKVVAASVAVNWPVASGVAVACASVAPAASRRRRATVPRAWPVTRSGRGAGREAGAGAAPCSVTVSLPCAFHSAAPWAIPAVEYASSWGAKLTGQSERSSGLVSNTSAAGSERIGGAGGAGTVRVSSGVTSATGSGTEPRL